MLKPVGVHPFEPGSPRVAVDRERGFRFVDVEYEGVSDDVDPWEVVDVV